MVWVGVGESVGIDDSRAEEDYSLQDEERDC